LTAIPLELGAPSFTPSVFQEFMAAEPDEVSQEAFWKTVANRNEPAVEQLEKLERLQSDITALRNSIKFAGIARASWVTEFLVEAGFAARGKAFGGYHGLDAGICGRPLDNEYPKRRFRRRFYHSI
jgi:hypothetical protein